MTSYLDIMDLMASNNKSFPNPEGKINVLKKYLHIFALFQHMPNDDKQETRYANSLED